MSLKTKVTANTAQVFVILKDSSSFFFYNILSPRRYQQLVLGSGNRKIL